MLCVNYNYTHQRKSKLEILHIHLHLHAGTDNRLQHNHKSTENTQTIAFYEIFCIDNRRQQKSRSKNKKKYIQNDNLFHFYV